jgi:glycosyltransferase involved in cell wall biosynthesis
MKVCVVGLRGLPGISGGIETHCENLFGHLMRQTDAYEITVFGRKPYIGSQRYATTTGIKVVPAFALKNKYLETLTNTFVSILRAKFGEKTDFVHIHAIGPGLLAPLAMVLGVPVVLTHHGDDFRREKWNSFAKAVLRLGERVSVACAAQIIAVSPTLADRLREDYPKSADIIHYIPNGANHIVAHGLLTPMQAVLDRFGLVQGDYVVSVGRLVPEKGFADLIRAHKASGSTKRLVIVGGTSNSDHDKHLEKLAHDGVLMTGTLPQSDVAHLLAQAHIFILASHHEGLPIAALEAWAMGAPLLLSDIRPNKDLGLPANHYFPVGKIDALAALLADTAEDVPQIALPEEFNWSSISVKTAAVYDELHATS